MRKAATTLEVVASDDLEITYGIHQSPFGWCLIATTKRGICQTAFLESKDLKKAAKIIIDEWPKATLKYDNSKTKQCVDKMFSERRSKMHLLIKGTRFQIKVWKALLSIPEGKISNYSMIAKKTGSPKAFRAVGTACGKNPICFLIPCHRVLTSSGKLGGYHWGLKRKEALLAWESIRNI